MIRYLSNVLSRGMIVAAAGLFAAACSDSTAPTPVVRPSAVSMANQAYEDTSLPIGPSGRPVSKACARMRVLTVTGIGAV